jgi:5-methyltetrahydrofolate--homocysteine methyltransferase
MRRRVKKLALSVEAPLVIDSTEANVIEAALEAYPGCAPGQLDQPRERPARSRRVMPLVASTARR